MREIFKLVGTITLEGLEGVKKGLYDVDKESRKISRSMGRFGRDVGSAGKTLTTFVSGPIIALTGAMAVLATKTGEYADKLQDLVEITGLSTDTLQEMEHVARVAGVSFEGFAGAIAKFSRQLPQIQKGGNEVSRAIEMLGVNVFDSSGNVRDMNVLFPEMVRALQLVENTTTRNAIAQQLFGRSLADVAPVLGMSAEEFEAARVEAHALGLVMSGEALDSADAYRVEVEKLKAQFTAFLRNISGEFIPVLRDTVVPIIREDLIPLFTSFAGKIKAAGEWFRNLNPKTKEAAIRFAAVLAVLGPLLMLSGKIIISLKALAGVFAAVRIASLALSGALATNPFFAAAAAVGVLTAALWGLHRVQQATAKNEAKTARAENINRELQELTAFRRELEMTIRTQEALRGKPLFDPQALADAKNQLVAVRGVITQTVGSAGLSSAPASSGAAATSGGGGGGPRFTSGAETEAAREAAAEKKRIAEEMADIEQELALESVQMAMSAEDRKAAAAEAAAEKKIALEKQLSEISAQEAEKRIAQINTEYAEKQRLEQETAYAIGEGAVQLAGLITQLAANRTATEIQELDKRSEMERIAVENSTLTEEQKAIKFKEIDEEAARRRKQLLREQAKRDKAAAIFGAIINTAMAISKALTLGFPLGIVMAVIMGVLGAAQIAVIASQPLPMAEGGLVKGGRGGIEAQVGEGSQDELVFPMKTGVRKLADDLIDSLSGDGDRAGTPAMALAGSQQVAMGVAGGGAPVEHHWHIGTLIADDRGIKELERRQYQFRVAETQRKGAE